MDFDFDPLRDREKRKAEEKREKVGGGKVFPPPMETRENQRREKVGGWFKKKVFSARYPSRSGAAAAVSSP